MITADNPKRFCGDIFDLIAKKLYKIISLHAESRHIWTALLPLLEIVIYISAMIISRT